VKGRGPAPSSGRKRTSKGDRKVNCSPRGKGGRLSSRGEVRGMSSSLEGEGDRMSEQAHLVCERGDEKKRFLT